MADGIETCEELAAAPFFDGAASLVVETNLGLGLGFTLKFGVDAPVLGRLGFERRAGCPDEASVIVAFERSEGSWLVDRLETGQLDNAGCLVEAAPNEGESSVAASPSANNQCPRADVPRSDPERHSCVVPAVTINRHGLIDGLDRLDDVAAALERQADMLFPWATTS